MNLYIYSKKISKRWKNINTKGGFQFLYLPVILIDSVYRNNENYYPKVFLEKYNSIEDIAIYFDEECINLFLENLKK